jgi:hypothetical protein
MTAFTGSTREGAQFSCAGQLVALLRFRGDLLGGRDGTALVVMLVFSTNGRLDIGEDNDNDVVAAMETSCNLGMVVVSDINDGCVSLGWGRCCSMLCVLVFVWASLGRVGNGGVETLTWSHGVLLGFGMSIRGDVTVLGCIH